MKDVSKDWVAFLAFSVVLPVLAGGLALALTVLR